MRLQKLMVLLSSLIFITSAACSQNVDFPPPYVLTADTAADILLPKANVQYYLETGKDLTISDVTRLPGLFKNFNKQTTITGKSRIWLRYQVKNGFNYPVEIAIPSNVYRADVYISETGGNWQKYLTGRDIPWSKKSGLKKLNAITFKIPAGEIITVYKRAVYEWLGEPLNTGIGIKSKLVEQNYIDNDAEQNDLFTSCMLFGFLGFAALFNFFFYYTVREKVYLLYGVFLLIAALYTVNSARIFIVSKEFPLFTEAINNVFMPVVFYLAFLLARMFLQTAKNHPRWNRVSFYLNLLFLLLSLVTYLIATYFKRVQVLNFSMVGVMVIMLGGLTVNIIADLIKKRFEARLFLLAICPSIFFLVLYSILALAFQQRQNWLEITLDGCFIWGIIVLSWSLFERYKSILHQNTLQVMENERVAREAQQERNRLIEQQNEMLEIQVAERTSELNRSLIDLKQTQAQLIQSEKMASLGELTAGIAHEIQNPLNFVNNFSEVSAELLDELEDELRKGDTGEAIAIAGDVKQNLQKILHHGKRADNIVKGMLQHSRSGVLEKQPADVNKLTDEFFKLSYHAMRTRDKTFNAELVTNYDETLPKMTVAAQDIGRVLLNLFNNAFYAVQQKSKIAGPDYKPTVVVKTLAANSGSWGVSVRDNGIGISEDIKGKILQPFFTTKPTGEGTGLGLSISYDIIVKAHSGKIDIDSREGEYTEFIISIPVKV